MPWLARQAPSTSQPDIFRLPQVVPLREPEIVVLYLAAGRGRRMTKPGRSPASVIASRGILGLQRLDGINDRIHLARADALGG